jgi:uncharacterized protein (TIGR02466 family)
MIPLEHLTYQQIGVTEPGEVVFMRPFGPAVGHATLPPETVEAFNRDIDNGTDGIDWSDRLVGKVHAENLIPTEVIQEHVKFFTDAALGYVDQYASRHCHPISRDIKPVVSIHSAWYVRQKAGDFNPVHLHTNAELSAIGYLQMPDDIEEEWAKDTLDHYPAHGHVEFMHGSPTFLNRASFMVRPKAGDFFIFPADMLHTVYPFRCDGERRSFSMNIILAEKDDDDGEEA